MLHFSLLQEDLEHISSSLSCISQLQNKHIFITGANGFFGIWLIESLLYLNEVHKNNTTIYALTRSERGFYKNFPHLKNAKNLNIIEGTVLTYKDNFAKLDYIIHAANLPYDNTEYWATRHMEYAVNGTKKITETAKKYQIQSILFTSSGAVYNNFHNLNKELIQEEDLIINTSHAQVYSMGKIVSEQILKDFNNSNHIPVTIARCFAFAGAYLPLENFALGNFIKNAILKEEIIITGAGNERRSYLYGTDLVIYLLTMLIKTNDFQVYNVGCEKGVCLKDLARYVSEKYELSVNILNKNVHGYAPTNYIPSAQKLYNDCGLQPSINLTDTIEKMYTWYEEKLNEKS